MPSGYHFVYALQQIDSLNVVAVGDSGNIFRTFDGGVTWSKQTCPAPYTIGSIWGVHFHDPMNGIIGLPVCPAITTDGGIHRTLGPFTGLQSQNCHCYDPGQFAVLNGITGKIYRTSNSWTTMDSTLAITDTSISNMDLQSADWAE